MKKLLIAILVVVLMATVVLTGCTTAKTNLIMATGGTSGTYYSFGGAICQIYNTKLDNMNVTAQSTGASKENIRLIGSKEAELAIVQNDVMDYAYQGIELFNGEKIQNIRTVAILYPEIIQIVVSPDSGINSIADMKGKRISVGDAGSGVEANAKQILEAYGLTFDDIQASHLSFSESASAFKDKQLDGFFVTAGSPNPAIQEITALSSIKLLSVDDATADMLIAKYPFYTKYSISKETYKGMESDANTLAVMATLIAGSELEEDVVYKLTKALFEYQTELATAHAKGNEMRLATAVQGVSVPFHPGAEKYYKEKGLLE
ncbi:MAG: TAXI family TRAP transporter solute-binding subunit [Clostridiaceae bacterium]|jgi:TRAP transporter TAXI family solute receptor|nr:TAXI family TRAP transporter solute-binding subunit [Clostridiaceae bacterium]